MPSAWRSSCPRTRRLVSRSRGQEPAGGGRWGRWGRSGRPATGFTSPTRPTRAYPTPVLVARDSPRACPRAIPAVRDILLGGGVDEGLGSNNWVVDGTLTATGKPMLANDPHLSARLPSTWYLAHVTGGDFEVIGATLPGAPAVALGRNRYIAWGATNVAADVEDLYRERLDASGTYAEFRGVQEPITVIPGNHRRQRRGPCCRQCARDPPWATRFRRDQREQCGVEDRAEAAAARAARLPLDRARRRRPDGAVVPEAERGARLEASLRRRCATSSRRHRISSTATSTATSGTTRPDASRYARRATDRAPRRGGPAAPSGPAGFRSKSCRTRTTLRSISLSRQTIGPRRRHTRISSGLNGPSRIARSGSPICCAERRG